MVWDVDKLESIPMEVRGRHTDTVGAGIDSYFTINFEFIGNYYNTLSPTKIYYDPFLYGDTDGINLAYVIDETIVDSDISSLTLGTGDPIDIWLWNRVLGNNLFGVKPDKYDYFEADFSVNSNAVIYSDWAEDATHDFSDDVWTSPELVQAYQILTTAPTTGYCSRDSNYDYTKYLIPCGQMTAYFNFATGLYNINFGTTYSNANMIRVVNPSHPNYRMYMPPDYYKAFVNVRSIYELFGDMTWLDTWDGQSVLINTSTHYFGSTVSGVSAATLLALLQAHPEYRPIYRFNNTATAFIFPTSGKTTNNVGDYKFFEQDGNWYVNGQVIFPADTDIDDLPFATPSAPSVIAAGKKVFSLGAMMIEDMSVVIAATKMPYFVDPEVSGSYNKGNDILNVLVNGIYKTIIKTTHCVNGSSVFIDEYHDARVALADGNFSLDSDSFLWAYKNYVAPQSWHGDLGSKVCIVGSQYVKNATVYQVTDIEDQTVQPTDIYSVNDNGTSTQTTTVTYSWGAPTSPYIYSSTLFYSTRTKEVTSTLTDVLNNPGAGRYPPGGLLAKTLTEYSNYEQSIDIRSQSGSAGQSFLTVSNTYDETNWTRTVTDPVPDIDGNIGYSAWVETATYVNIVEDEDYATDQHAYVACDADRTNTTTHTGLRVYSSTGGNVDTSPLDYELIETSPFSPTTISWSVQDYVYGSIEVTNTSFVHDITPASDYQIVYHTLEVRQSSDNSLLHTFAIGTPPRQNITNQYWGGPTGNGVFYYDVGNFVYSYPVHPTATYLKVLWTRTGAGAGSGTGTPTIAGYAGAYSTDYSLVTPASSGWHDYKYYPDYMPINKTPTEAPAIHAVTDAGAWSTFVEASRACGFDGRVHSSRRIQMGSGAEILTGGIPHASGRSLRGNTITMSTDSAGNPWVAFEPVVPGTDEVFIELVTGHTIMVVVTVTGATYITSYGTVNGITWMSPDKRKHYLVHPKASTPYVAYSTGGSSMILRDTTSIKPTDAAAVLTGYDKYPQWASNTLGYYEYTLLFNKLLADGSNIDGATLSTTDEVVLTTTSGEPFIVTLVHDDYTGAATYVQVIDDRGALYCVDEGDLTEWRLDVRRLTSSKVRLLYMDVLSQEKRVTDIIVY